MNKPKLILSTTSPYARRVRLAALENNVDFEVIVDVPWNDNTGVIKFNPLGKVPVWITKDNEAIVDSRVIVELLENQNGYKFSSPNPTQYLEIKRIEALAEGIMDASLCLFAERRKRPEDLQHPWWIDRQFGKLHRGLEHLQNILGSQQFLFGRRLTVADFALISALGYVQLRFSEDFSLKEKYPVLMNYYEKQMQRESVKATVPVL
ncbi:glutathione S-transferase C-terminal domain-containing protein [Pseudobdellovibrio sp. HCB154]|uniref:glutathione S-transferase C-terminal domain-containing protein n=1 Tax=Pseudobdellovibrio sp. HCB154 TaxID=3386277 RepID=UPI0039172DFB